MLHETLIFSERRDTYSIFIILHHMLMETSKEQGIRDSVLNFIACWCLCWAVKMANYLQNYQAPSVPQPFSRGKNVLRNTDVTKINFQGLKFCLPDLSADHGFPQCQSANKNVHLKLQTPAQISQWHFPHLIWGKGEFHPPKSDSQPSKAERLLKLTVWLFLRLTKSVPCKNKQKTSHEGKTVDFSPYCF